MDLKPTPISGFPELLPQERFVELQLLDTIRSAYESFGFVNIETPAVERNEVLTAKGGDPKEIYNLGRLAAVSDDADQRDFSLHFDLTVPLARYVAMNYGNLAFPFRRYQIQKVWRGERPQEGRFREFTQCDIDIIGDGELSLLADAEIPAVIQTVFARMGLGKFIIRVSNRKILTGLFEYLQVPPENSKKVMREVDKLERQGINKVREGLSEIGLSDSAISTLLDFVHISGSKEEILKSLASMTINDLFETGVKELKEVTENMIKFGVLESNFTIDLSVARGLDYYTGTVYETYLVDFESVGSICSGGRFDDLASLFIDRKLPGVGISIGLTRLFSRLLRAGLISIKGATPAPVLITVAVRDRLPDYLELASKLRDSGVNVEVYTEEKNLSSQLKYASKKGFVLAIIGREEDFDSGSFKVRDFRTSDERVVPSDQLVRELGVYLSGEASS